MRNGQSTDLVNIEHKTQSKDEHSKTKQTKQNKRKQKKTRKTEKMSNMEATKKNTIVQHRCS